MEFRDYVSNLLQHVDLERRLRLRFVWGRGSVHLFVEALWHCSHRQLGELRSLIGACVEWASSTIAVTVTREWRADLTV
jgi:hypothetical protein